VRTALAALIACALAASPVPAAAGSAPTGPSVKRSTAARAVIATEVRAGPGRGPVVARVGAEAPWAGGSLSLLVLGSARGPAGALWLRVRLPERPNGAAGWIRRDHVELTENPWRVDVSIENRQLLVRYQGEVVARLRTRVGAGESPTPRGVFAITEAFRTDQPGVGDWAIALTAFSDRFEWFAGGPGLIAIHGGRRVPGGTNGCLVVDWWAVPWLARTLPSGTPVVVR
jgi:hypothetical protein